MIRVYNELRSPWKDLPWAMRLARVFFSFSPDRYYRYFEDRQLPAAAEGF